MISYYKGQFLHSKDIHINEKLFRGIGIFETIKFVDKKILFFKEHMGRLCSNQFFNFSKLNQEKIYSDSIEVINQNSLSNGLIKIVIVPLSDNWDDLEYYIFIRELPNLPKDSVKVIFYSEKCYH